MEKQRLVEIDLIKAIGIIGVIAIHVLTYNLTNPVNRFIWNYAQFVVVAFVFSSGYILPIAYSSGFKSLKEILAWYKKRIVRLLFPFYVFLVLQYTLWILFPDFFSGLGLKKSPEYFIQSASLLGGTNFNFLPLLFVELSLIFPILLKIAKNKYFSLIYLFIAGLITFYFTFFGFPYAYYRLVMWIPWSIVLFLAIWMVLGRSSNKIVENSKLIIIGLASSLWFLILYTYLKLSGAQLNFYNHKYPPDFYYLFYGLGVTLLLLIVLKSSFVKNERLFKASGYVSRNSYALFFAHYLALDSFLKLRSSVPAFNNSLFLFISVSATALAVIYVFGKLKKIIKL